MRAVDTNVLIRFITADDAVQHAKARRLLAGRAPLLVPDSVVLECLWVLKSKHYGYSRQEIADALRAVFGLESVNLRDPEVIARTLELFDAGLDDGDAMHLALAEGECTELLTFDGPFVRKAKGKGKSRCKVRAA